jgi:hypothetical protein
MWVEWLAWRSGSEQIAQRSIAEPSVCLLCTDILRDIVRRLVIVVAILNEDSKWVHVACEEHAEWNVDG